MLEIVFQNQHFCVVDKPAGALSVPSRTGAADPRAVVGRDLETQLSRQIWPCHRLDEDVSGLLLFALTAPAHKAANNWFEKHEVIKTYAALAPLAGTLPPMNEAQDWRCRLMRGKKRAYEAAFGKDARTKAWRVANSSYHGTSVALWHLQPLTGRSHQLRYEMARHGWPIIGDKLYGSEQSFHEPGIALRATSLDFNSATNRGDFELPTLLQCTRIFSSV
jgi:tRNA pseudouridine32 synthase/23S rRNA pseudouridine746 synthase